VDHISFLRWSFSYCDILRFDIGYACVEWNYGRRDIQLKRFWGLVELINATLFSAMLVEARPWHTEL